MVLVPVATVVDVKAAGASPLHIVLLAAIVPAFVTSFTVTVDRFATCTEQFVVVFVASTLYTVVLDGLTVKVILPPLPATAVPTLLLLLLRRN
jgi:hypothetical protein